MGSNCADGGALGQEASLLALLAWCALSSAPVWITERSDFMQ